MTDVGKFLSDVEKLKKHSRQNGIGGYMAIQSDLRKLFEHTASCPMGLPGSLFEYWEKTYIFADSSMDLTYEPEAERLGKLGAMLAFLDNSDEDQELLSSEDWQEIGRLVNFEAEDLPINTLQEMMSVLVSKGAY
jgi:hypothetical protein